MSLCFAALLTSSIDLSADWKVSLTGTSTLTASRAGRTPLALVGVGLEVGTISGGRNPKLTQGMGFSTVLGTWETQVHAKLHDAVLSRTQNGTALSGALCATRLRPPRCLLNALCVGRRFFFEVANATGCIPLSVEVVVGSDEQLRTVVTAGADTAVALPKDIYTRLQISLASEPSEMLVGFGNQPSFLDLKNRTFAIVAQENGVGRGDEPLSTFMNTISSGTAGTDTTSYSAVPAWLSSHGHSTLVEGFNYLEVDTSASHLTTISILSRHATAASPLARGVLRHSTPSSEATPSWSELAAGLRVVTGSADLFPTWPLTGFVVGITGGSAAVRSVVDAMRAAGVALAGVWVQDWSGTAQGGTRVLFDWQAGSCDYPDWWELVAELSAVGIRVLNYVNPFLTASSVASSCGIARSSMYEYALEKGYLVRADDGTPLIAHEEVGQGTATIDLTSSAAHAWYRDVVLRCGVLGLREYCDASLPFITPPANATPIVGFMADFGEHLPLVGAQFASGVDAIDAHNQQADAWARLTHDAIHGTRIETSALPFHRSGGTYTPPCVRSFWAGDQEQYWHRHDGFPSLTRSYISAGLAGWGAMHSDIGGMVYVPELSVRTDELLHRWLEFSAFCDPILRSHPSEAPSKRKHPLPQPWSTPELLNATRRMTTLHVAMRDYKRASLDALHRDGSPYVTHTLHCCAVTHASSAHFEALSSQLMLGADVLHAPVLGARARADPAIGPPPLFQPCAAAL